MTQLCSSVARRDRWEQFLRSGRSWLKTHVEQMSLWLCRQLSTTEHRGIGVLLLFEFFLKILSVFTTKVAYSFESYISNIRCKSSKSQTFTRSMQIWQFWHMNTKSKKQIGKYSLQFKKNKIKVFQGTFTRTRIMTQVHQHISEPFSHLTNTNFQHNHVQSLSLILNGISPGLYTGVWSTTKSSNQDHSKNSDCITEHC